MHPPARKRHLGAVFALQSSCSCLCVLSSRRLRPDGNCGLPDSGRREVLRERMLPRYVPGPDVRNLKSCRKALSKSLPAFFLPTRNSLRPLGFLCIAFSKFLAHKTCREKEVTRRRSPPCRGIRPVPSLLSPEVLSLSLSWRHRGGFPLAAASRRMSVRKLDKGVSLSQEIMTPRPSGRVFASAASSRVNFFF